MSSKSKVLCERGKFFIETGTSKTFKNYIRDSAGQLSRHIPSVVLIRIENLINSGDRDSAITLWTKACEVADKEPGRKMWSLLFFISYVTFIIIALTALLRTF